MGRSIYCSSCKKEKELGRDNESCCKVCKSERNKLKRAKKREELGMQPWGSGKKLTCCCCGGIKESRDYGYCNSCRRKKDNEHRLAAGITKKHNTGLCSICGGEKPNSKWSYCLKCNNEKSAQWKRENPFLSEEERFKKKVRQLTRYAVRQGRLIEMPCEVCKSTVKIEAHHDDYSKPLEVRWLCRKHHREHHNNEKNKEQK